ncbi:MAG: DUF4013 domain-containing protein, partial [Planctomicrobium sp.]|nr:DUF4013 domain-containing protein [Planctomicrobium sp.]
MSGRVSNLSTEDEITKDGEVLLEHEISTSDTDDGESELILETGKLPPAEAGTSFPVPWKNPIKFTLSTIYYLFASLSLMLVLAVVAAIPLVNFYVLGYFVNVEGRVAKSGRFRDGFPLLHVAPRLVTIAGGIWLFLLPLRFLAGFAADAHLIDSGSQSDVGLHLGLNVAWVLVSLHLILALARGGTFWCFVRPFKNFFWLIRQLRAGNYLSTADQQIQEFVQRLEIRKHYWLGLRGFAVAFIWLLLPTALYTIAEDPEGLQILLTIIGGFLLTVTLSWVPFLQARFAAEDRFAAGFQLREIRSLYSYAPIVWSLAVVGLYLMSLPLYLFKAFLLPQDAMWPITFIFVLSIYPTRLITGWAYQRAVQKRAADRRSHWIVRWLMGGTLIPVLGIYV